MTTFALLAQAQRMAGPYPYVAAMCVALALMLLGLLLFVAKRYKRCPSNRVLVIFGKVGGGNTSQCIHGGAAFVWPLIQDHAYLSLEPIQIEIPLKGALSIENIRVNVPSVFTVAIGTEPEVMQNAAIRLLGLNTEEIKQQAERHHLRPAAPGDRLDAHRGHQPRPRAVPAKHPDARWSRS